MLCMWVEVRSSSRWREAESGSWWGRAALGSRVTRSIGHPSSPGLGGMRTLMMSGLAAWKAWCKDYLAQRRKGAKEDGIHGKLVLVVGESG